MEVILEHYMHARMPRAIPHSPKNKKYPENAQNFDKLFFENFMFCAFCTQIIKIFFWISNSSKYLKINYNEISMKSADYIWKFRKK